LTSPDNERPGDPTPRFNCCLHRLGARTFALNLGQLRGCPPHWDLDEIPVIATGFSILSRQRRHLGTLAVTAPAGARDAEPAERRYLRLPAVGAGGIGCSFPSSTPRSRNSGTPKFDPPPNLADRLLERGAGLRKKIVAGLLWPLRRSLWPRSSVADLDKPLSRVNGEKAGTEADSGAARADHLRETASRCRLIHTQRRTAARRCRTLLSKRWAAAPSATIATAIEARRKREALS
jgi:hypothetical protein